MQCCLFCFFISSLHSHRLFYHLLPSPITFYNVLINAVSVPFFTHNSYLSPYHSSPTLPVFFLSCPSLLPLISYPASFFSCFFRLISLSSPFLSLPHPILPTLFFSSLFSPLLLCPPSPPSPLSHFSPYLINISSITLYVTGGIRCVKINAYLEQVLGFTNVSRLAGGIISYTRELEQEKGKSNQVNDNNEIIASTDSVVDENESNALTMISKPLGARNALIKEDSLSAEVEVEDASSEEIGIHLSRNLLGSKFKVPISV
jgi:hypothetical protein